jgi:hypothetical protein
MKRVFVSYSRNNLEIVSKLIEDLQAMGIDTWHDQTLTGGQRWWDNILANIRECDIFVFALSPESWDSEACKSELDYVVRLGRPILPVLVSDGINMNLLSAPLSEIQVMDYRECDKGAAFALVKSINTASAAPALPDPLPTSPPVPVSYLSTLKEQIDSHEPLSAQAQITLLFELEEGLREGRSPVEVRDLLLRLKRRDELLAKIAVKIDAALKSLENRSTVDQPETAHRPAALARVGPGSEDDDFSEAAGVKFCTQCGSEIEEGKRFCANCGAVLGNGATGPAPGIGSVPEDHVQTAAGSKCRRYVCPPANTPKLLADVKGWLNGENFDTQQMQTDTDSLLLQIKKRGGWRDFVGMSTSLNILFHQTGDTLTVEIGAGKWIDKAAVGTVSMFILWPLAITAGFGAWEQMNMPDKVFDFIGSRLVYR